jgi:hypothetical protein
MSLSHTLDVESVLISVYMKFNVKQMKAEKANRFQFERLSAGVDLNLRL